MSEIDQRCRFQPTSAHCELDEQSGLESTVARVEQAIPDVINELEPNLRLSGVSKSFGGAQALSEASLEVLPGETHGLLGENGSGKSTLIKILAGFHAPDSGKLEIRGQAHRLPLAPSEFRSLGLQFVHQDLGLVPTLSVLENLLVGQFAARRGVRRISWARERQRAVETFARYDLAIDPDAKMSSIRPVEQALVAIVRAVEDMSRELAAAHLKRGVLLLDEPTAFLPKDQVDQLFQLIGRVVSTGASVVFVSHDLDEVRSISDRITVLRNGRNVATVTTRDVSTEDLVGLIVGRSLPHLSSNRSEQAGTVLATEGLTGGRLRAASLEVRAGEVLGVTGLLGSGFEDLPYVLFGAEPASAGELSLFGVHVDVTQLSPRIALRNGIALIPGNRQRDGSIGTLTAAENVMVLVLDRYLSMGRIRRQEINRDVAKLMDKFDIRPREPDLVYSSFSGGNQQKAMLAKWLQLRPRVLLLDEPTQGVDVGARLTILRLIREAAAAGTAVVCASSDYEQLALLCDRVLVIGGGTVVRELAGNEVTKERITEQCLLSLRMPEAGSRAPRGQRS